MPLFKDNKKIGRVFHGTKEINKIYQGDKLVFQKLKPEGYIEIEVDSTSGSFMIPFSQRAAPVGVTFSFNIFVNGVFYGTHTLTAQANFYSIGYGYNITGLNGLTARIMLTPTGDTAPVGWGRAFGFWNGTYGGCNNRANKDKLLKVLNDPDYAHLQSETQGGGPFRNYQYAQCANLTETVDEDVPNTVISFGNYFREGQYLNCTSLTKTPSESLPVGVHLGQGFREGQYNGCTSLTTPAIEVLPIIGNISHNFRNGQYGNCTSLTRAADEVIPSGTPQIGDFFRYGQYNNCPNLTTPGIEAAMNNVQVIGIRFRERQYMNCPSLEKAADEGTLNGIQGIGVYFRTDQYAGCTSLTQTGVEAVVPMVGYLEQPSYFRLRQYYECPNLRIGNHIHAYGFREQLLNHGTGASSDFGQMFYLSTTNSTPDTVPRYYTDAAQTTTASVTSLTPVVQIAYLTNRTGISGYATINSKWK